MVVIDKHVNNPPKLTLLSGKFPISFKIRVKNVTQNDCLMFRHHTKLCVCMYKKLTKGAWWNVSFVTGQNKAMLLVQDLTHALAIHLAFCYRKDSCPSVHCKLKS